MANETKNAAWNIWIKIFSLSRQYNEYLWYEAIILSSLNKPTEWISRHKVAVGRISHWIIRKHVLTVDRTHRMHIYRVIIVCFIVFLHVHSTFPFTFSIIGGIKTRWNNSAPLAAFAQNVLVKFDAEITIYFQLIV